MTEWSVETCSPIIISNKCCADVNNRLILCLSTLWCLYTKKSHFYFRFFKIISSKLVSLSLKGKMSQLMTYFTQAHSSHFTVILKWTSHFKLTISYVNNTTHINQQFLKVKISATCFSYSESSSGQKRNTVLAHSVTVRSVGSHRWMYQNYVPFLAWWWLTVAEICWQDVNF